MLQLSFLLAPSSNLSVATTLPALSQIRPPRQGLQAKDCFNLGGGGCRPATVFCSRRPYVLPARAARRCEGYRTGGRGGAGRRRRQHRRHKTKPKEIGTGAPVDHTDRAPTSTAALSFPEPDTVALALCVSAGPPALVISFDPMLEELAASLVVSWPMRAATPECLPAMVAPQEVEAPVADTCSPTTAAQWTTDLSLMSPVQGPPQLTPPQAGAPSAAEGCTTPSDATSTPREAA